jgi:hypothetical protein
MELVWLRIRGFGDSLTRRCIFAVDSSPLVGPNEAGMSAILDAHKRSWPQRSLPPSAQPLRRFCQSIAAGSPWLRPCPDRSVPARSLRT